MVLKDYFYIFTQELCDTVVVAEKAIKKQAEEKRKIKAKVSLYKVENKEEVKEKGQDNSESEIGDCIIVNVE